MGASVPAQITLRADPGFPWAENSASASISPPRVSREPGSSRTTMGTPTRPKDVLAFEDIALNFVLLEMCVAPSLVVLSIHLYSPVGSSASLMNEKVIRA